MKNKSILNIRLILALIAILAVTVISGCSGNAGDIKTNGGETGEVGHFESGAENGVARTGGEAGEAGHSETGIEGSEGGGANALAPSETYDVTKNGARLVLLYDATSNSFVGSVQNTTNRTLIRVRVEIHLSNGTELGPTTPIDLAPGEISQISLPATRQAFDSWSPHAEVGAGEGGAESGEGAGEAGETAGHPEGGESGDPSSPILALNESWDGEVNGIRVAMAYDQATQAFVGVVQNMTAQEICYVQIELNLKQGATTVVELGPGPVGNLAPGAQANIQISLADEPQANGVSFDAWEIHPEMFDCNGSGPVGNSEDAGEGSGGEAGEHGPANEGGSEHDGGGEGSGG